MLVWHLDPLSGIFMQQLNGKKNNWPTFSRQPFNNKTQIMNTSQNCIHFISRPNPRLSFLMWLSNLKRTNKKFIDPCSSFPLTLLSKSTEAWCNAINIQKQGCSNLIWGTREGDGGLLLLFQTIQLLKPHKYSKKFIRWFISVLAFKNIPHAINLKTTHHEQWSSMTRSQESDRGSCRGPPERLSPEPHPGFPPANLAQQKRQN